MNRSKHIRRLYTSKKNNIILEHVRRNLNIYIILFILFIIGFALGVILVNNISNAKAEEINNVITDSINILKADKKLYKKQLFIQSIKKNILIIAIIWTLGLSFLGKYLLYAIPLGIGITFGYTTSSIMMCLDIWKSLIVFVSSFLLHNLITIPTIIFLCLQGIKCHNNFKTNSDIKYVLVKYTIITLLGMVALFFSSIVEVYISDNLLIQIIKYL